MLRILKYTLCVLAAVLFFSVIGTGDVGNFNSYSSGGSHRSHSSSVRRSYSSSQDYDYDKTRERSERDDFLLVIVMMLLAAVWGIVMSKHYHGRGGWPTIPDNTFDITTALQKQDPNFDAVAFLEWAKEVFLRLQNAWMERDWEQVRSFESEELYAQHARQLQEYKRLGRINVLERINVNNAYFFQLIKSREWETLGVVLNVRMIDYIIDEETRRVLKGSPDTDCFMSYFYVFKRKAGAQTTSAKQSVGTIACPNCGAPTHVVSSGRCEYCNFVITVKDHGWVLTDIVGIKPASNYGAGGVIIQDKTEE